MTLQMPGKETAPISIYSGKADTSWYDPNAPKTVAEDEGGSGEKAESGDTVASAEDSADTEPTPSSDPPSDQPPNGEDGEEELENAPQTEGLQEISSLADAEEKN